MPYKTEIRHFSSFGGRQLDEKPATQGAKVKRHLGNSTRVDGQSLVEYVLVLGLTSMVIAFLGPVLRMAVGLMGARFLTGLFAV